MKFTDWKRKWESCTECEIGVKAFRHVVLSGNLMSKVLFCGEGPGASEDALGIAFVGPSGQLIRRMIKEAGTDPDSVMFTNLVACRPWSVSDGRVMNRPPTREEILNCHPRIEELVKSMTVRGRLTSICFVGLVAKTALEKRFQGLFPNLQQHTVTHPAYLVRRGVRVGPGGTVRGDKDLINRYVDSIQKALL